MPRLLLHLLQQFRPLRVLELRLLHQRGRRLHPPVRRQHQQGRRRLLQRQQQLGRRQRRQRLLLLLQPLQGRPQHQCLQVRRLLQLQHQRPRRRQYQYQRELPPQPILPHPQLP